ncbi:MAG: DUF4349 domain-containing protein [Anaeroplasmataceae bacterium]
MKKIRKLLYLFICLLLVFTLASCGNANNSDLSEPSAGGGSDSSFVDTSSTRKIIYEADLSMHVSDLSETYKKVKSYLPSDAWTQTERTSGEKYYLVIRISYKDFDKFIADVSALGEVDSCQKKSKDVTSNYELLLNKKQALETEYARLLELMETASASDITTYITPRLTEIETQLLDINNSLTNYDESVSYSTINLTMYQNEVVKKKSFGTSLKNAFINGGNAFVSVIKFMLTAIAFLSPFVLVAGAIVGILILINNIKKNKKTKAKENTKNDVVAPPKEKNKETVKDAGLKDNKEDAKKNVVEPPKEENKETTKDIEEKENK